MLSASNQPPFQYAIELIVTTYSGSALYFLKGIHSQYINLLCFLQTRIYFRSLKLKCFQGLLNRSEWEGVGSAGIERCIPRWRHSNSKFKKQANKMKQNNNNKTTFLCPLSSTWPQELPICPAWLPESDSCHLISTITSSKEGEEMFVLTEGSLMRCVELKRTPSVLIDRPSQILSTVWGDYVFHSCVKLTEKDPQWNVLWRGPMLVCGPPCGTLGWSGGDPTKMSGAIREQVPNSRRKRNSEKGEVGANGI